MRFLPEATSNSFTLRRHCRLKGEVEYEMLCRFNAGEIEEANGVVFRPDGVVAAIPAAQRWLAIGEILLSVTSPDEGTSPEKTGRAKFLVAVKITDNDFGAGRGRAVGLLDTQMAVRRPRYASGSRGVK